MEKMAMESGGGYSPGSNQGIYLHENDRYDARYAHNAEQTECCA